jgi:hypothetical protein
MKLRTLGTLGTLGSSVLATVFVAGSISPALAQQWPTADPSYSAADPALATGPEGFGAPGQIVVSSDFDLGFSFSKGSDADSGVTTIEIAPALMFFVARNVAVGGLLDFRYTKPEGSSTTDLRVGPLVGYNVPLGPRSSLLPTLGLTYGWSKTETDVDGGQMSATSNRWSLIGRVPILFHPFTHVFVGLAPYVLFDLSAQREDVDVSKDRVYGVTLDLGFWL